MSFLRRHILVPILFWMFILGGISLAISYSYGYLRKEDLLLQLTIGMSLFTLASIALIFFKLHLPIQKIISEMKALLTGKSYKRIVTTKRNEIGILAHFFNEVTRNLENISGDMRSHERIKKELNTAQQIQRDLLPKNAPEVDGLEITAKTRPASEIGGDTFDFFVEEKRTVMYIGDSTGHGIPAGIVMVMVDTLLETFIDIHNELSEIMISLNKYIKPHLQTTMFMTMILLEWIPSTNTLKWIGAGHEHILHYSISTGEISATPAGGIAVGMLPDNSKLVKEQSLKLDEGDFIILFSDGITEAKNIMGEIYSLQTMLKFIKNHVTPETSAEDLFKGIAIDVGRFMEGHAQEDDMTLIVMKHSKEKILAAETSTSW